MIFVVIAIEVAILALTAPRGAWVLWLGLFGLGVLGEILAGTAKPIDATSTQIAARFLQIAAFAGRIITVAGFAIAWAVG